MLNAETYITKNPGINGKIRTRYEDFYVEEIPEILPSGQGPNTWIWIEKLGRTTLDVVLDISRDLHISRKRMGFAGMKDKKAITRQWICVSNSEIEEIEPLKDEIYNVKFLKITKGQKKLRMGQLIGNKFRILVRDLDDLDEAFKTSLDVMEQLKITGVPNYYGWQRFGRPRTSTHKVGRALVENDLEKAVKEYIGNPSGLESEDIRLAREAYDENDLEKSYELMPTGMRYERMMLRELIKENKNHDLSDESYKKALLSLPKPLQRMFIHAYQSALFNKAVSKRASMGINSYLEGDMVVDNDEHLIHDGSPEELDNKIKNFEAHPTAPLFGLKVPLAGSKIGEMEQSILDEEKITKEDFECSKLPKLGSFGLRRAIRFKLWDTSAEIKNDALELSFSIPKGSYATAVLREIMKVEAI